jgi:uncharacterized protein (DUF433 family)
MRKTLGRYLVVDSKICHGQPTFRGTRILVKDVLEQVAQGMAWKSIEKQWRGAVSQAAIAEAVQLANKALLDQLSELAPSPGLPMIVLDENIPEDQCRLLRTKTAL